MNPPKAVIFDLGNVLIFHDDEGKLFPAMAEKTGVSIDRIRHFVTSKDSAFWQGVNRGDLEGDAIREAFCKEYGITLTMDEFIDLWTCHFTIHDAVLPLIDSLVGRVKLLLLSNVNGIAWEWIYPRILLLQKFDHHLLSHEYRLYKPEPAFFQAAVDLAGVLPQETVFFDDLPRLVEAARDFGIRAEVFTDAPNFERQLIEIGLK